MKQQTKFKQTGIGRIPEDWEEAKIQDRFDLLKDGTHNLYQRELKRKIKSF